MSFTLGRAMAIIAWLGTMENLMARIESSDAFAAVPTVDLGQGDRINLGVAGIMSRLPDVAAAVGGVTNAVARDGRSVSRG